MTEIFRKERENKIMDETILNFFINSHSVVFLVFIWKLTCLFYGLHYKKYEHYSDYISTIIIQTSLYWNDMPVQKYWTTFLQL